MQYKYRSVGGKIITVTAAPGETEAKIRAAFEGAITPLVSINGKRVKSKVEKLLGPYSLKGLIVETVKLTPRGFKLYGSNGEIFTLDAGSAVITVKGTRPN